MKSSGSSDRLNLERGLPVTPADVAALRAARARIPAMSFADYLAFLSTRPPLTRAAARARRGPRGEPFVLSS